MPPRHQWQTRLEAQTDLQLVAEDRAQLDAHAHAGIDDPTRGPGTCLHHAA